MSTDSETSYSCTPNDAYVRKGGYGADANERTPTSDPAPTTLFSVSGEHASPAGNAAKARGSPGLLSKSPTSPDLSANDVKPTNESKGKPKDGKANKEARNSKDSKGAKEGHEKKEAEKSSKKGSSSRSRRERRERQAAQATAVYGWEGEPTMWDYSAGRYPMDFDLGAVGMDTMVMEAMAMDPYMDPAIMGMGMEGGYMDPMMGGYGQQDMAYSSPLPSGSGAAVVQKKTKAFDGKGASEGLSIHAKPWSPSAEPLSTVAAAAPPAPTPVPGPSTALGRAATLTKSNRVEIRPAAWCTAAVVNGVKEAVPVPMVPSEVSDNEFVHSLPVVPTSDPEALLAFFTYKCARCPLRTLYGRLSSRRADVTVTNVAPDIPPLCLAHLLEQVSKVRITALVASQITVSTQYDIWLDKTSMASPLIAAVNGLLWTCPMPHGFAVVASNERAKVFLQAYLTDLKKAPESAQSSYPLTCVEVKEH